MATSIPASVSGTYPRPAPSGKTAGKAPSPFAQMSGAQISNMIAGYTSKLPQPLNETALQGRAQGMLDPVIKSITDRLDASGRAGAGAITGYANSLASSLEPYQQSAHNIYANAESSQAASDAALSSALKGQGNSLAASLADKLAGFGAGDAATAATTAPAATVGAGAGNALLANGSASLADLISQGASAESYASKLPGIARTQGLADLRDLTLSNGKQRTDAISQLEQQLPSLVQNLRSENDSRANAIGSTKLDLYKFLTDQNVTKAGIAANSIKAENAALPTFDATNSRALGYASDQYGNPVGGNVKPLPGYKTGPGGAVVKDKPAPKPAAPPKVNSALSKQYGYQVDTYGHPVLDAAGKKIPIPGAAKGPGNLSPTQTLKFKADAATIAQNAYNGFETTDKNGTVTKHPPIDYQKALAEMAQGAGHGAVPLEVAQAELDKVYKPGERSRPWLSFQDRQRLLKAGAPPALVTRAITDGKVAAALVAKYAKGK